MSARAFDPARYELVAALTAHLRLATTTKLFCNCSNARDAAPNAQVCPVCLGLPGTLPLLNARVVALGARLALAMGAAVEPVSQFARAHEPSPTLPKGYRIVQRPRALGTGGVLRIGDTPEGAPITVATLSLHLEEGEGEVTHGEAGDERLDCNAAGAPRVVIATAATLRSSDEAIACLVVLRQLAHAVGALDAATADEPPLVEARVGVRERGDGGGDTTATIIGLRGTDEVRAALDAALVRLGARHAAGEKAVDEVLRWNGARGAFAVVAPEAALPDARLLAEPDLPPLVLTSDWLDAQRAALPELPHARRTRLRELYALDLDTVELLTTDPALADYYESVARRHGDGQRAARWTLGAVRGVMREHGWDIADLARRVRPADLATLLDRVREGALTEAAAADAFATMARTGKPPGRVLAARGR